MEGNNSDGEQREGGGSTSQRKSIFASLPNTLGSGEVALVDYQRAFSLSVLWRNQKMSPEQKERVCGNCYWMKTEKGESTCHVPIPPLPNWLHEVIPTRRDLLRDVSPHEKVQCQTFMEDPILKEVEPAEEEFKCEGTTTD